MIARIGVAGCGWWATRAHLPALAHHPRAVIAAIADPDPRNRQEAQRRFGIERHRAYEDVNIMLDQVELDGVIVAVPHHLHARVAEPVLDRGIHTLLEKPMTLDAADAHRLQRLARTRACELIVGYPWHYNRHVLALRAAVESGRIGRLESVTAQYASIARQLYRGAPERYGQLLGETLPAPATYADPDVSGGGQAVTQTTHVLALLLWLTGLRPRDVAAMVEGFELDVDLVDGVLIGFEGDVIGTVATTGALLPGQEERLEVRLFGSDGHVLLDLTAGRAAIVDAAGVVERLTPVPPLRRTPEGDPARNLVDVSLGRAANGSPSAVAVQTVELIEAVYRSARTRRVVRLA